MKAAIRDSSNNGKDQPVNKKDNRDQNRDPSKDKSIKDYSSSTIGGKDTNPRDSDHHAREDKRSCEIDKENVSDLKDSKSAGILKRSNSMDTEDKGRDMGEGDSSMMEPPAPRPSINQARGRGRGRGRGAASQGEDIPFWVDPTTGITYRPGGELDATATNSPRCGEMLAAAQSPSTLLIEWHNTLVISHGVMQANRFGHAAAAFSTVAH